jgi:hypothetical protein
MITEPESGYEPLDPVLTFGAGGARFARLTSRESEY